MEAGPSSIMQESVAGNTWLESAQQKHSIFLSHGGAQKAFVRRLRNALERNAYHPFFDEDPDCLPKGEPFAQRIKEASRLADVAVVVLSDEFLKSKWPMIELAIFVKEQRRRRSLSECKQLKILPLFMGFSVDEFRHIDKQTRWWNKWYEMGSTDSRIDVSEWNEALKILGSTNGLEYCLYKTEEEYIDSIVSAIFKLVTPDLKWDDTHVKGKSKFHQVVEEMFARSPSKTRFHNVRCIGLYGVGGIGKTTICRSLCNKYNVKFNGKVWHAELGKKSAEDIQKDVLRHLVGTSETLLNQTVNCKDQWQSLLRRRIQYKVFLAIDNVWNEDVSQEQAEALLGMGFHPDSLVIITSRSRELLEWLGISKECCFEMPVLDKGDATAVLLQSAAPGCDVQSLSDHQRVAVDKVVERCFMTKGTIAGARPEKQYIPLALEVLGRQLRLPLRDTPTKLTEWVNKLDLKRSNQKQHPIFSVLRLSYDNLPSSKHKSIFLDVALCVPRQQDNTSTTVNEVCKWLSMVYGDDIDVFLEVLQDLQRDGLVESWKDVDSPLGMHELYCEFVKAEVGKEDNFDQQIYLYQEDGSRVPALMRRFPCHNYFPLRRIHIYSSGIRELSTRELRFMLNVEVLKLDFCFELESLDLRCLKSLRSLELRGCFLLQMVEGLEDLQHLKFFRWNTCRNSIVVADFPPELEIVEIYGSKDSEVSGIGSFEECVRMLELTLSRHPLLTASVDLCKLHKLEKVDFSGCCKVEEVRGLGGLRHLRHLNLQNCRRLCHCDGLEKLAEIETLNLGGCDGITLPEVWDLTRLINLRSVNIVGNLFVRRLVLGSPHLEQLEVTGCINLRTVTLSSGSGSWKFLNLLNERRMGELVETREWTVDCWGVIDRNSFDAYKTLNFSNCQTLESLDDIGLLRTLRHLYLQNCIMLKTLPDLNGSPYLEVMDFSYCCMLEDLGDIGRLGELRYLDLQNCRSLRSLPHLRSSCLKVLDLSGCFKVETLGNFDSLGSLQVLNLNGCASLKTVPNLSHSPLLEVLNVKGCVKLTVLSQMTTHNVVIDISECWSLKKIPILDDPLSLELDVSIEDIHWPMVENMAPSQCVRRLKLTCKRFRVSAKILDERLTRKSILALEIRRLSSKSGCDEIREISKLIFASESDGVSRRPVDSLSTEQRAQLRLKTKMLKQRVKRKVEWRLKKSAHLKQSLETLLRYADEDEDDDDEEVEEDELLKRLRDSLLAIYEADEQRMLELICARRGSNISHFKNVSRFLELEEWKRRGYDFHRRFIGGHYYSVKFSSISISSESLIVLPLPAKDCFSNVSSLEFTKCRRLRQLSDFKYLRKLETLVISQCDELESLPNLLSAWALKHLTIRDFRQGPKFQFLSHLCRLVHDYTKVLMPPFYDFKSLVELNLDGCVGLGGLQNWGPLPELESLLIKDCNTITQLPDLRKSSKLSKVIVMNCGKFRENLDTGPPNALQVFRIEGCGNDRFTDNSTRERLCCDLVNFFGDDQRHSEYEHGMIPQLIAWLKGIEYDSYHLDIFSAFDFSKFTGPTLEKFNLLMATWDSEFPSAP